MKKKSIKEIEAVLEDISLSDDSFIRSVRSDERKGVQALLRRWEKRREQEKQLHEQFVEMQKYENELTGQGYQYIAGIDEVGRGPLAGPVVAAAVLLPVGFYLPGLTDSKQLSAPKREQFCHYIKRHALSYGIGMVNSKGIDQVNIYEATKLAMMEAIEKLDKKPDYLLIDAMKLETPIPQTSIIKGDASSISIAAASVLAKETRDQYMKKLAMEYPAYGFEKNMGYGTKEHLDALKENGLIDEHRRSFSPVKEMVGC
jgi:ribonuclease HII